MAQAPLHTPTQPTQVEGPPPPQIGDMLGAYRLDAVAGEGGMGRVFAATHTKLNKRVAVKVLRRRYSRRPEAIQRFFEEARAVNVIRHPNVVEITDVVEAPPGGDSYYIMEWLDGRTLAARLRRDRMLPWQHVVTIGRQVASALAAVHRAGLVHRDLKPDNIFILEEEGRLVAKLLDFGVALAAHGRNDGTVAGTPAYFSPEGAAGRPLDGRSDIYSLGVLLYELLAGRPPFQAASMSEYVLKHMTARPRPLGDAVLHPLPLALVQAIDRCLEKEPGKRFQTMDALEAVLAELERHAAAELPRSATRWKRRLGIAALALMVASALATRGVRALWARSAPATGSTTAAATASEPAPAPETQAMAAERRIEVRIDSDPPNAEVSRDGRVLGTTPCTVRLPPGPQTLDLVRPGSQPTPLSIEVRPGASYTAKLAPVEPPAPPAPPAPPPPLPAVTSTTKPARTPVAKPAPNATSPSGRPVRKRSVHTLPKSVTIDPFD